MLELLFLLLPVAAASGWYMRAQSEKKTTDVNKQHYFQGINYLLNEQPDKAVDVFIKALEVDSDTVEIHLAVGNLFRRRGEVERSIRIHQNLIARPQLSRHHKTKALLALGQDYLKAGFLDRAEHIFLEIIKSKEEVGASLHALLDIYQQQKNWQQAIDTINQYKSHITPILRNNLAHYYCELALQQANESNTVKKYLKKALQVDDKCVRANLMLAELMIKQGQYKKALRVYKGIQSQDREHLNLIIPAILTCYEHLGDESGLMQYFEQSFQLVPETTTMMVLAKRYEQRYGIASASDFITQQLIKNPSLITLGYLTELYAVQAESQTKDRFLQLKDTLQSLLIDKANYQCKHCGVHYQQHHWQCHSCKHWGSLVNL